MSINSRVERRILLLISMGENEVPAIARCAKCGRLEFVCCDQEHRPLYRKDEHGQYHATDQHEHVGAVCVWCCHHTETLRRAL